MSGIIRSRVYDSTIRTNGRIIHAQQHSTQLDSFYFFCYMAVVFFLCVRVKIKDEKKNNKK